MEGFVRDGHPESGSVGAAVERVGGPHWRVLS